MIISTFDFTAQMHSELKLQALKNSLLQYAPAFEFRQLVWLSFSEALETFGLACSDLQSVTIGNVVV